MEGCLLKGKLVKQTAIEVQEQERGPAGKEGVPKSEGLAEECGALCNAGDGAVSAACFDRCCVRSSSCPSACVTLSSFSSMHCLHAEGGTSTCHRGKGHPGCRQDRVRQDADLPHPGAFRGGICGGKSGRHLARWPCPVKVR